MGSRITATAFITLQDRFQAAIREDAPTGDITSQLLGKNTKGSTIDAAKSSSTTDTVTAKIIAKQAGVFSGEDILDLNFDKMNLNVHITRLKHEGQLLEKGDILARLTGASQDLLLAERPLLNLLQRTCGVASTTRQYVTALNDPSIQILDTRKTTPLWRDIEKKAVRAGGGHNHRMGLSDMVLLKENHLTALKHNGTLSKLPEILATFKAAHPHIPIQIEVETLDQLEHMEWESVDYILLDNFSMEMVEQAVRVREKRAIRALLEVSGNVSLETICRYRHSGIHRISIGKLTHSVQALDLSLLIE